MSRRRTLTLPSASSEPDQTALEVPSGGPDGRADDGVLTGLTGASVTAAVTVEHLPAPYDVSLEVAAPLSSKERADLKLCEQALHGFRKALVVAGKALEVINRGRLYRETHGTFADYVWEVWGIRKSQAYRLIEGWPIAVAVSPIGDINEAQARELLPVYKDHGPEAAVAFFRETTELAGERKVTAAALAEARAVLPAQLAAPEQAADVLRVAAAEGRVPRIVPPRAEMPEQPSGEAVVTEDVPADAVQAGADGIAVLEAALAQQKQIYDRLAGVVAPALLYDPGRADMLLGELRQYANRTAYRARGRNGGGNEGHGLGDA